MTFSSDKSEPLSNLSPNGQRLLDLRDAVLDAWEMRVRERVLQARALQHPILINTLPAFYDNIAQSISPGYPRLTAVDGNTLAAEHGGERARVTSYDHAALIDEYQVLRWAIFEVLHREQVELDHRETHTIHASINAGIHVAVEAFSLVHSGLRERFAAALTHDLPGPLSVACTGLELILLTNDLPRIKMLAAKALGSSQRMGRMIDELLDTMAFQGGQKITLALTAFDFSEVVKEVQIEASANHGPRIRVIERSVHGVWDRSPLKRVLENLVGNAVKYGTPDTPITIRLEELHGRLVLSVHNEGNPIPPHEQECIFQMYRRAEAAQRGARKGWGSVCPMCAPLSKATAAVSDWTAVSSAAPPFPSIFRWTVASTRAAIAWNSRPNWTVK